MPNVEHNTSARGASTFGVIMKDIQFRAGAAAAGCVAAAVVLFTHSNSKVLHVSATGKMELR